MNSKKYLRPSVPERRQGDALEQGPAPNLLGLGIGPLVDELLDLLQEQAALLRGQLYLVLALLGRNVESRVLVLGDGVDRRAVLEQEHDDVHVAQPRSDVQRRLLFLKHRRPK